jgi:type I pantothenate kinase
MMSKLIHRLSQLSEDTPCFVIGLTGSVASGKTTLAREIVAGLSSSTDVEMVSTDGFLYLNAYLNERGLLLRKGFPETFDHGAMSQAICDVRKGAATFPAYSHDTFDIVPELAREIKQPEILVLEGLGFSAPTVPRHADQPDVLIYLDAHEDDLVFWYVERFVRLWRAAADDPSSFYAQWLHMSEDELRAFAVSVWERINRPNLHEHIAPLKNAADIVLLKSRDHKITMAEDRTA